MNSDFKLIVLGIFLIVSSNSFASSKYQVTDDLFPKMDTKKEELGKLLMYDKILSGNKNISCATCHHPLTGLGDGLALPIGEGGNGLGISRNTGTGENAIHERVPRNAPHIFNLGADEFTTLFHDGRVAIDSNQPSGFLSPAGDDLPKGLDNPLAVQAMFPVTSAAEMAGQVGENAIANLMGAENFTAGWALIANRIQYVPEYVTLFIEAFNDVDKASDITYVHIANAIAAFEASAWRCTNSPFDRYFKNENLVKGSGIDAVSPSVLKGATLFYGKANCSSCHSGPFQTDHKFHAIAVPQIGPGKGDNQEGYSDGYDDFGRERVTGNSVDRYKFRTPSLRQINQTGPWGHDGAFNTLEAMVRHHLDAVNSLTNYDKSQALLPSRSDLDALDFVVQDDAIRIQAIADANELTVINLSDKEVNYLIDFLDALSDPSCVDLRHTAPTKVPSGLPLQD